MGTNVLAARDRLAVAEDHEGSGSTTAMNRLERLILDHEPTSLAEAIAMLDVALPDLAGGGRTDGRDISAVIRVRDFLLNSQDKTHLAESG